MTINRVSKLSTSSGESKCPLRRQEWLRRLGVFGEHDPFPRSYTELEAEREKGEDQDYESYLIEPPGLTELPEQGSGVLFARRGDGKTTSRLIFAQRHSEAFLVEYTDFFSLIPHLSSITPGHHIYEICKIALFTLARHMEVEETALARYQLDSKDWIFIIDQLFTQQGISSSLTWIRNIRGNSTEFETWKGQLGDQSKALVQLAICLLEIHDRANSPGDIYPELLPRFFQALNNVAGCPCAYILVDKVDAFAETKGLDNCEKLLKHLLGTDQFHGSKHVHFRFFLPMSLAKRLLPYRSDQIAIAYISWTDPKLLDLVGERLKAASDGRVVSLTALTQDKDFGLPFGPKPSALVKRLVSAADGSPRNMLALCHELLDVHVDNQNALLERYTEGKGDLLTNKDFDLALERFDKMKKKQQPPPEPDRFKRIGIPVFVIIALLFSTALILVGVFRVVPDLRLAIPLSIVLILLMVLFLSWLALAMEWIAPQLYRQILDAILGQLSLPRLGGRQDSDPDRDKGPP